MRFPGLLLPCLFALGGCSLFNQVDDLKHLASDAATGTQLEAGDEVVDEAGPAAPDGGIGPKDAGAPDTVVDAGSTAVIVIGGAADDGGTTAQIATLDPSTGKEIGSNNRMTLPAGKKLGGILYDGEREDLFYVFETSDDPFAPAILHVMHLVTHTGTWKEVSTATNLPPPTGDPGLVALHNTIVYKTNIQGANGGPASVGVAFLNTKQAEDGTKVVPISVGTAPVLAVPFIPRGVIGIPHAGENSLQDIDIVQTDAFPCTGNLDDAGTPFCGMYLHRVTISNAGVSPVQMVAVPTGKFLWKDGAGISWATDLVTSLGVVIYPPVSYNGLGEGQGAIQQYSDDQNHTTQLNPPVNFGPVKGPWLVGTTLAQCERIVITMGFIQNPWLYAIPLDRNGVAAVSMQTIENGGNIVYEPTTRTILAPNRTDLRPFILGGTPTAPTLMLRTTGWQAPRDINVTFAVAKAPLFPKCQ